MTSMHGMALWAEGKLRRATGQAPMQPSMEAFSGTGGMQSAGALARIFYGHDGRLIHKWEHYFEIYEHHFAAWRGKSVKMLEIGVSQGGSLEMWRKYLGQSATVFGIDIDPACAARVDPPNQVRIGSQADPGFLNRVVDELGTLDIALDDGSHVAEHQRVTFETLWPRLAVGGLYVIEDMHTAYWPYSFNGGYRRSGTAIEAVKTLIDDLHGHYHHHRAAVAPTAEIKAIHVYDSIAVIEKANRPRPFHVKAGGSCQGSQPAQAA